MENKKEKDLSPRDIVRIVRKEIIANRNETTALRAEIAVMRTELSGMHKVMEENKLFIQSIALSLKTIREVIVGAGEGLDSFFADMKEAAKELIPAMVEMRQGPVTAENDAHDDDSDDETVYGKVEDEEMFGFDKEYDEETPIERDEKEHSGSCPTYNEGVPCCLEKGHAGDHFYKCESPLCPGYAWADTPKNPHPMTTCHIGDPKMTRVNPEDLKK